MMLYPWSIIGEHRQAAYIRICSRVNVILEMFYLMHTHDLEQCIPKMHTASTRPFKKKGYHLETNTKPWEMVRVTFAEAETWTHPQIQRVCMQSWRWRLGSCTPLTVGCLSAHRISLQAQILDDNPQMENCNAMEGLQMVKSKMQQESVWTLILWHQFLCMFAAAGHTQNLPFGTFEMNYLPILRLGMSAGWQLLLISGWPLLDDSYVRA